jgi:outer membrane protein assembly factor BamB
MALIVVGLLTSPALASGWRQPRFDGGRNPFNPEETLITSDTVKDLHEIWSTKVGSGGPLLLNGVIYRAGAAISADDGGVIWQRRCMGSAIAVTASLLVAERCGGRSIQGRDPATGSVLWTHRAVLRRDTPFVFSHGVLYGPTREHRITALDASTGDRIWSRRTPSLSYATLAHGVAYVSDNDGVFGGPMVATRTKLYAFQSWVAYSAKTGEKVAEYRSACSESMCVFDGETHELLYSVPAEEVGSPAVTRLSSAPFSDGGVFALCGSSLCSYAGGREPVFNFKIPLPYGDGRCAAFFGLPGCRPIVAGDVLYNIVYPEQPDGFGSRIVARSLNGTVLRRIDAGGSIIVADGLLIAYTGHGLTAFSPVQGGS